MADKITRNWLIRSCLTVTLILGVLQATPATARASKKAPPPEHYRVKIDPAANEKDLLPIPPKDALPSGKLLINDLAHVPEAQLHEPLRVASYPKEPGSWSPEERDAWQKAWRKAVAHNARLTTQINFVNKKKTDRFMELLIESRPDLSGLPFSMGDACRMKPTERKQFKRAVELVNSAIPDCPQFWGQLDDSRNEKEGGFKDVDDRSCVAACMQMLAVEECDKVRRGLVPHLATYDKTDAAKQTTTTALTKLAVFSPDAGIRKDALAALEKRGQADAAILIHGLRYPWPAIAKNAAEAATQLKRKDLIPEFIKLLDEPDPRAPVRKEFKGTQVPMVREVVKINHHRNCLLCHPPGNTPDVMTYAPFREEPNWEIDGVQAFSANITKQADDVLIGTIPTPGENMPTSGYRRFPSPDLVVRADITYLRQDFSMLQRVDYAHPWPTMQRFDYLVRSRTVTDEQAKAYLAELAAINGSPYRDMAAAALRGLTGKDRGTDAKAWRTALGMN